MGALLLRNLRHHRALLGALALGVLALELLIIRVVGAFESGPGLRYLIEQLPALFRDLLASQLNFISFAAGVAFGFQHPAVLVGAIALVIIAATIPAHEREQRVMDLILARPVPRSRYLLATLGVMVTGAILLPASLLAGVVLGLAVVDAPGELAWSRYVAPAVGLVALLLATGGFTLLAAAGARRRGPAAAQVSGLLLALFVVELTADLWAPLSWIRWASPFHYFKPVVYVVTPPMPWTDPAVLLGIFAVCTTGAFLRFRRQDL